MLLAGQAQKFRAQQRASGQIERPPRLLKHDSLRLGLPLRLGQRAEIYNWDGKRNRGFDNGGRPSILVREGRSQGFVPAHNFTERLREGWRVEDSFDAKGKRDVVEGGARLQLLEEPEAFLGKGEWRRSVVRSANERGEVRRASGVAWRIDLPGQAAMVGASKRSARRKSSWKAPRTRK